MWWSTQRLRVSKKKSGGKANCECCRSEDGGRRVRSGGGRALYGDRCLELFRSEQSCEFPKRASGPIQQEPPLFFPTTAVHQPQFHCYRTRVVLLGARTFYCLRRLCVTARLCMLRAPSPLQPLDIAIAVLVFPSSLATTPSPERSAHLSRAEGAPPLSRIAGNPALASVSLTPSMNPLRQVPGVLSLGLFSAASCSQCAWSTNDHL